MRRAPLPVLVFAASLFATVASMAHALPLANPPAGAQPPAASSEDHLRFTLILSRHGIRPPLTAAASLSQRSADPWPSWDVPLGELTAHGADAITRMGAYMRLNLANAELLPASGCPVPSDIYLYSDTDERNIASTHYTFAALAANCPPLPIHTVASKTVKDSLFQTIPRTFPGPPAEPSLAAMHEAIPHPGIELSADGNPALLTMAHILAPEPSHPATKPILEEPISMAVNPSGDPVVTVHGPLFVASALEEDLLLEYVDDKPMTQVGWGRVDEPTIRSVVQLHAKAFGLSHRTMFFARAESSNLMAHILDTLEQAFNNEVMVPGQRTGLFYNPKVVPSVTTGAIGPPNTRLVYMSGHDTNLTGIGGLLNLHWSADGIDDYTPPDSQLVFELWQNAKTKATTVRLYLRAQTLDELRSLTPLTLASPPVEVMLTPPGCKAKEPCSFMTFDGAARKQIDRAYVKPELDPLQIVKP